MHASGVSGSSGLSFFVLLHDAAVMADEGAKRVIKTVYTRLHSEASMGMTSALWRKRLTRRNPLAAQVQASQAAHPLPESPPSEDPSAALNGVGASPKNALDYDPDGASAREKHGDGGDDSNTAVNTLAEKNQQDKGMAQKYAQPGDAPGPRGADASAADLVVKGAAASAPDEFALLAVRFVPPAAHVPRAASSEHMEELFTAGHRGWSHVVRSMLSGVRVLMCSRYNVLHKTGVHTMMRWWQIKLIAGEPRGPTDDIIQAGAVPEKAEVDEIGDDSSQRARRPKRSTHYPYPVIIQKRHLPFAGERKRNIQDMGVEEVCVVQPFPPRGPDLHQVVASLLLIFDMEACVPNLITKTLSDFGVVRAHAVEDDGEGDDAALLRVTLNDSRLMDGFGPPSCSSSTAPTSNCTASSSSGPGAESSAAAATTPAAAAHMAARKAAGSEGRLAGDALRQAAAEKRSKQSLMKGSRKRGTGVVDPSTKKRARLGVAGSAKSLGEDLAIPDLDALPDVIV